MKFKIAGLIIIFTISELSAQSFNPYLTPVSIQSDDDFSGFDLLETENNDVFVLAEHWHNIQSVPRATMKLLKYLYQTAGVRILAIEQGASVAHMINSYLDSGDTTMLRNIIRETMFWGKENWEFFENLRTFNLTLPEEERVFTKSIDIEYKMESAIFVINELIGRKEIPKTLQETVGAFQHLYRETLDHRESFQGISVMYYYNRDIVESLVLKTIDELERKSEDYLSFFGDNFVQFATMILQMDDGLTFDYVNPNTNYKFRDRLIYQNFIELAEEYPETGILCVIGMRHATKGSSIHKLKNLPFSPLQGKIKVIKVSALLNKMIVSSDLRKVNFNYPNQLKNNEATLVKHMPADVALKSSKDFDYTLFINKNGSLTPFDRVLTEEY